jgi:hypothetical protein
MVREMDSQILGFLAFLVDPARDVSDPLNDIRRVIGGTVNYYTHSYWKRRVALPYFITELYFA